MKNPRLKKRDRKPIFRVFIGLIILLSCSLTLISLSKLVHPSSTQNEQVLKNLDCDEEHRVNDTLLSFEISRKLQHDRLVCTYFNGKAGQEVVLNTNVRVKLVTPTQQGIILQGESKYTLPETGKYSIHILSGSSQTKYKLTLQFVNRDVATTEAATPKLSHPIRPTSPIPNPSIPFELSSVQPNLHASNLSSDSAPGMRTDSTEIAYNVPAKPPFRDRDNFHLQIIVSRIIDLVRDRGLSESNLSISLVDLASKPCCAYASYLDKQPRYPASITKLFWIVALYAQYNTELLPKDIVSEQELRKMIQDSDNEAASHVVDVLTKTESGSELAPEQLKQWIENREWINRFFEKAGYHNPNLSQKNFPIPYLGMDGPANRDLQIRTTHLPEIRNSLTTYDVARLLYEIDTGQAVSPDYSRKIKQYMWQDLRPEVWQTIQYNSIEGFLAESLPVDTYVASKVGWYAGSRQDAAIIEDPSGKVRYILVIFGEDEGYANDWEIFPEISRMVYEQMFAPYK